MGQKRQTAPDYVFLQIFVDLWHFTAIATHYFSLFLQFLQNLFGKVDRNEYNKYTNIVTRRKRKMQKETIHCETELICRATAELKIETQKELDQPDRAMSELMKEKEPTSDENTDTA
jgi:hypothetical protein